MENCRAVKADQRDLRGGKTRFARKSVHRIAVRFGQAPFEIASRVGDLRAGRDGLRVGKRRAQNGARFVVRGDV